jgi:DNA-binding transcriptional LysR family regulator
MDRLDAMRTFLAVADHGSFIEAARQLRLSSAGVTRAVAQLEADLGVALLRRTTRSVALTERGAIYADRCRRVLSDLDEAATLVRGEDAAPRGMLSVTAPVMFGQLHILPVVEQLAARHPDLTIRLTLVDRVTHLVEEGFDAAVRIGTLADSALVGVPLAQVRRVIVASPAYLDRHGIPEAPGDLRGHSTIAFVGIGTTNEWRLGHRGQIGVALAPRLSVNTAAAAIAAADRGFGIAQVLSYQVREAVAEGRLVRLLPQFEPEPLPATLLYQASRRGAANIRAFALAARERLAGLDLG